jgi:hypothetical protein
MIIGCALAAALFSAPVQARDNDRDRDDTSRSVQRDRSHNNDRATAGRSLQRNRNSDRGRHNGYAYGQTRTTYRGNGYYRRNASAPFAYIGAADQRRNGYARRNGNARRSSRHRRHHHH